MGNPGADLARPGPTRLGTSEVTAKNVRDVESGRRHESDREGGEEGGERRSEGGGFRGRDLREWGEGGEKGGREGGTM